MLKITVTCFALVSVLFLGKTLNYADQPKQNASGAMTGTLQKMIVENGSVTLNLDLNGLNGSNDLTTRPVTLQFAAGTNSFFPILVFNDELRGLEPGSIALAPQGRPVSLLPAVLAASLKQLVVEKLPSDAAFDLAVRDGKTGLIFFNIEGNQYDYDPRAALLSITGGNLLVSKELANVLRRPADAGAMLEKSPSALRCNPLRSSSWSTAKSNQ